MPPKARRPKREKPPSEEEPTLAQQVFSLLTQIASMYMVSLLILAGLKYFNIAQGADEVPTESE